MFIAAVAGGTLIVLTIRMLLRRWFQIFLALLILYVIGLALGYGDARSGGYVQPMVDGVVQAPIPQNGADFLGGSILSAPTYSSQSWRPALEPCPPLRPWNAAAVQKCWESYGVTK